MVFFAPSLSDPVSVLLHPREPSSLPASPVPESWPRGLELFGKPHVTTPAGWRELPFWWRPGQAQ